jgi:hypothetical protein
VYYYDGIPVEGALGMYSIFSLDALHFNNRGNSFIANVFIKTLNEKFSIFIPQININNYTGNVYSVNF